MKSYPAADLSLSLQVVKAADLEILSGNNAFPYHAVMTDP
jgi:hypothetical protein